MTTAERIAELPDLPTVGEFLPGFEASAWYGIGAPRDTPAEIIDTLNRGINAALAEPKIKARLEELGCTVIPGSPADLAQHDRRRDREMGQGGDLRRAEAGVMASAFAKSCLRDR